MDSAEMLRRLQDGNWWGEAGEMIVVPLGREATIDDLAISDLKTEIVGGTLVVIGPSGCGAGGAAGAISFSLKLYERQHGGGRAFGSRVSYVVDLPGRGALCPDASWYVGPRWSRHPRVAPVFAAEVRDAIDQGPAAEEWMVAKRADYFAAGTKVVWDVDVLGGEDVVRVYRADDPDHPTVYRRGKVAEAEPAVPGWRMPVDELFD
jgi:Uma2 family endonuclease